MTANYPTPQESHFVIPDFRFHTGEVLPELRLHYLTIGEPSGEPVIVLHGTASEAVNLLTPQFAGELFGPGQPLDAEKYFIIMPDALGAGKSARPSDGLRMAFPRYNYDDMVAAQYRLVTEGLGIPHLRLVIGNSMGGMHAWLWPILYPKAMDAVVAMAAMPTEMSARNWITRRLLIEAVRHHPEWNEGNYTAQPRGLKIAHAMFSLATNGGTLGYQVVAPTRELADKLVDERLAMPFTADANDFLYQWDSARDYNPAPHLEKIEVPLLAINAADDERNPPETGLMEAAIKRVRNGRLLVIPPSSETRGHGTTQMARFWKRQFQDWLQAAPRRTR